MNVRVAVVVLMAALAASQARAASLVGTLAPASDVNASCPTAYRPALTPIWFEADGLLASADFGIWTLRRSSDGALRGERGNLGTVSVRIAKGGTSASVVIAKPAWLCRYEGEGLQLVPAGAADSVARPAGVAQLVDASAQHARGLAALAAGDTPRAGELLRQAWTTVAEVFGADSIAALELELDLAGALAPADEALRRAEHAAVTAEARLGTDHPFALTARVTQAITLSDSYQPQKALDIAEATIARQSATAGERSPSAVRTLNLIARAHWQLEHPAVTRPIAEKSLLLSREVFGADAVETLRAQHVVTGLLLETGDLRPGLTLAEDLYARTTRVLPADHPYVVDVRVQLSLYYQELGRLDDALQLQKINLSSASAPGSVQRSRRKVPAILMSMGWTLRLAGRQQEAYDATERALALFRELRGAESTSFLTTQASLGVIDGELGRADAGIAKVSDAFELHRTRYGDDNSSTVWIRNELGELYLKAGRPAEAIEVLGAVLEQRRRLLGAESTDTIQTAAKLAAALEASGNAPEALAASERVVDAIEGLRRRGPLSSESRQALLERWIDAYKRLAWLQAAKGDAPGALRASELAKARTLVESLSLRSAAAHAQLDAASTNAFAERTREVAESEERLAAAGADATVRIDLEKRHNEALARLDQLKTELMRRFPKFAQLSDVPIVDAVQARALLPRDAVLVSYLLNRDHLLALTLSRRDGLHAHDLGSGDAIADAVAAYRTLLFRESRQPVWRLEGRSGFRVSSDPPGVGAVRVVDPGEIGAWLAQRLLTPLAEVLDKHHSWILSADGALAVVPFSALPWHGNAVVRRHDLSFVPSLSVLSLVQDRARRATRGGVDRRDLLAIGAPAYGPPDAVPGSGIRGAASPGPSGLDLARFASADGPPPWRRRRGLRPHGLGMARADRIRRRGARNLCAVCAHPAC